MTERWYRNAVIYALDIATFQDSNDDGIGDLPGLINRLDYLSRLGVTAIWLSPIHPSPWRDGGYDVADHYQVHPMFGSSGDFAELLNQADERGLRVLLDLVVNHTSDENPWFQAARAAPDSPWRDWYVWSKKEPPDRKEGAAFPGVQDSTWTYDEKVAAWYHHRFYEFEPDLNTDNPAVRDEIRKILAFWLRLGVGGFRVDAAPHVLERMRPGSRQGERDYRFLTELREMLSWRRGDAVMLAEANVDDGELLQYFGGDDDAANRFVMVFAFRLNQALMLALARQDARPIAEALKSLPELPRHAQWVTFLRNHDEVDLGRLSDQERQEVFAAFGPDESMQLYGRGLRRRLAPMFDGDQRRLRMAYALQFSMPGTPVVRYGDEIGMGEDLSLDERNAIRTPMQWSDAEGAGFTSAAPERLVRPLIDRGPYAYRHVNVTDQRRDPDSLLAWFERIVHTMRECEEIGSGDHTIIDAGPPHVLVVSASSPHGVMLLLHNLADQPCRVRVPHQPDCDGVAFEIFADDDYGDADLRNLDLGPYGYRWLRLSRPTTA